MNPAGQLPKFFEAQPPANSADEESGLPCAGGIVPKPPPDAALIALLSRVRRRRESRVRPGRQSVPDSNESRVDLQRFSWLVEDGFQTSLKQGSDSTVFSIEPHAVADVKPMDRFAKVRLSALHLEMVVVANQGVTVELTRARNAPNTGESAIHSSSACTFLALPRSHDNNPRPRIRARVLPGVSHLIFRSCEYFRVRRPIRPRRNGGLATRAGNHLDEGIRQKRRASAPTFHKIRLQESAEADF
jgi:hypothetical protein